MDSVSPGKPRPLGSGHSEKTRTSELGHPDEPPTFDGNFSRRARPLGRFDPDNHNPVPTLLGRSCPRRSDRRLCATVLGPREPRQINTRCPRRFRPVLGRVPGTGQQLVELKVERPSTGHRRFQLSRPSAPCSPTNSGYSAQRGSNFTRDPDLRIVCLSDH